MAQVDLEQEFEAALKEHLEKARVIAPEVASGLLEVIAREGALNLIRQYLAVRLHGGPRRSVRNLIRWSALPESAQKFSRIIDERGRPGLTLERLVLSRRRRALFTEEQLAEARERQACRGGRKIESKSKELLDAIDRPDDTDDSEEAHWARKVRKFVRQLAHSRETFVSRNYHGLEGASRLSLKEWLDDYWAEEMLQRVPKMVKRTLLLDELLLPEACRVPLEVTVYMREATRCFIFGLWQSAIAMARAALEKGLQDTLGSNAKLAQLIQDATQLGRLQGNIEEMATEVRKAGNDVLHGEPATGERARDTVRNTREVLTHLYARRPS